MSEFSEIRGRVTSKIDVLIRANQPDINLDEPLYAINWFSTKTAWIYHFYNFLASRSVRKIGGRAFFKGEVTETILDESDTRRDLILIIRYPDGQSFKALMESTYFKMVSIFRILSVKRFTFGFTHKLVADTQTKKEDNLSYAIHHFKVDKNDKNLLDKIQNDLSDNISIKYAGQVVATLNSQEKNQPVQQIPTLMDGVLIYQSSDDDQLRSFFDSEKYQAFLKNFQSSHISLLKRIAV